MKFKDIEIRLLGTLPFGEDATFVYKSNDGNWRPLENLVDYEKMPLNELMELLNNEKKAS